MDKNLNLAYFITSFGSMNDYSSSVLQTKKVLDDQQNTLSESDQNIFEDALAGIKACQNQSFSSDLIININKSFTHAEDQDPILPGHLRNAMYNSDDVIGIVLDKHGHSGSENAYFPPDTITKGDLEQIVNKFNKSDRTSKDGLRVFADLSKLQPFQDGNKRTALLAANSALNTFDQQNYLTLPFNAIDHTDFMLNLMRFYKADSVKDENKFLNKMYDLVPSIKEVNYHLTNLTNDVNNLPTRKLKPILDFNGINEDQTKHNL